MTKKILNIDEALVYGGSWGLYQKVLYSLVFIAGIPNAFLAFVFFFSHYEPDFHCRLPDALVGNLSENYTENEAILDYFIPMEEDPDGGYRWSQCRMYNINYTDFNSSQNFNDTPEIIPCNNGWTYNISENHFTAITEYDMVCENGWKEPLALTMFQVGKLLGAGMGSLADRCGRRPVFLVSSLFQVLAMVVAGFSWNYGTYVASMFIAGLSGLVNFAVAFVLATEIISVKWRNFMTIGSFYSYAIGYCMVPGLGYLLENWRWYLWTTSIISAVCYLPNYWLFPESPRWLLSRGNEREAEKELYRMIKMNKKNVDSDNLEFRVVINKKQELEPSSGILDTFRIFWKSGIITQCLVGMFGWFVSALVYFSIAYYSTSFSEDRYFNLLYAGLAEIPAYIFGYYSVKTLGRPRTTFILMSTCGITSIALPFVEMAAIKTLLSVLGKAGVSATFYVVYLLITEVIPTPQRSSATSLCSMCARVGSMISPFMMYAAKTHKSIPNFIMGGLSIAFAFLTILYIPETNGVPIPDTVEDAKSNKRFYRLNIFRNLTPNKERNKDVDIETSGIYQISSF